MRVGVGKPLGARGFFLDFREDQNRMQPPRKNNADPVKVGAVLREPAERRASPLADPTIVPENKPYRIWSVACPFRKDGSPIVGNTFCSSVRSVVIFEHETFKRLIAEHPALATARFEVGEFVE